MSEREINAIVESAVKALGFELVGCELLQPKSRKTLRVYIDSEYGVTLEDCAKVSRHVGAILDVEDLIAGRYDLEVSSPGLDRPLFKLADYQRFIGKKIKLRLRTPVNNQRNFVGILREVKDDMIQIHMNNGESATFNFNEIDRANLVPEF